MAALEAWGRVPGDSPEGPVAALARARLAIELNRYGLAEACLKRATRGRREVSDEAWRLLGRIYWITGRRDEYRRLLQKDAERSPDPSEILRTFWSLDHDPYQIDAMTQALARAKQSAPDDDRVWLALADLEMRVGHYDEAADWLTRCEHARPNDADVWNARLRWARLADRPDELLRAAAHLPAAGLSQSTLLSLRAWLAARSGDRQAERSALEESVLIEPADTAAIERLADLAAQNGEKDRVAALRRQKASIEAGIDRYKQLVNHAELPPLAAELRPRGRSDRPPVRLRRYGGESRFGAMHHSSTRPHSLTPDWPKTSRRPCRTGERWPTSSSHSCRTQFQLALSSPRSPFPRSSTRPASEALSLRSTTAAAQRQMPETMSGGVALLDFDGDGWLDIYAVQGESFPRRPVRLRSATGSSATEATAASRMSPAPLGLAKLSGGYGHGVAVGDYDNDGRPDIFVTRWRSYALYHNLGGGPIRRGHRGCRTGGRPRLANIGGMGRSR